MGKKALSRAHIAATIAAHRVFIGITLCLILVFGYVYFFNQFWTHLDPASFDHLTEYTGSRIRGHRGRQILVHRDFYDSVSRLNRYAINNQLHIIITQSYRPPNTTVYDAIVTPAVRSNHLAGHAVDFNVVYGAHIFESDEMVTDQFQKLPDAVKFFISDLQADPGIRWGGDFETRDPIHLDDSININDPETWEQHYHQCVTDYANATPKWKVWLRQVFSN